MRSVLVIWAVVQRLSVRLAPRRLADVTVADSRSQCSSRAPLSCADYIILYYIILYNITLHYIKLQ